MTQPTSVLFVCLGNICRSPLAEGVMRHLVRGRGLEQSIEIDSCGTSSYHVGEPPHPGSAKVAKERGVSLAGQRSRQVADEDFSRFEWIVAMDRSNLQRLQHLARGSRLDPERLVLLLDYARGAAPKDVPDPYYEGGFGRVFDLIEDGCTGLLDAMVEP